MSVRAWVSAVITKRQYRHSFQNRARTDGTEEFIIKVEGFSGELRKVMTEKEAEEWVEKTNKSAFMAAASASSAGLYGIEQFNKHGKGGRGMDSVIMKVASSAFADKKEIKSDRDKNN